MPIKSYKCYYRFARGGGGELVVQAASVPDAEAECRSRLKNSIHEVASVTVKRSFAQFEYDWMVMQIKDMTPTDRADLIKLIQEVSEAQGISIS